MIQNIAVLAGITAPVRQINARVEFYTGSTLFNTFTSADRLIEFDIERVGDSSKFIGYGICQRLNVKLIDANRELNISTAHSIDVYCGANMTYLKPFPRFYVSEVHRDENTNALSITAYDAIYAATNHRTEEIELSSYTIGQYAAAIATILGVECSYSGAAFNTQYATGANFDGTETLRDALNAIAEATQTIYYINENNVLVFKALTISGAAVFTIDKELYFKLDSSTNRRLTAICHATELGDNVVASLEESGTTQYIRDNPLWELREDIATLVDNALSAVGGLTINQFDCSWRGNFLLQIGDKINLITKDGNTVSSYLLDDTITYDGTLSQRTKWSYSDNSTETAANPTSIGDAIKQTYARVDKANHQIELVASLAEANSESISSLIIDSDKINAMVSSMSNNTQEALDAIHDDISTLTQQTSMAMTPTDVQIAIQTEMANGVDKVITKTGFTFNEDGLTVSKNDSEMSTIITEDGMKVYKDDEAVLTANNVGVEARNLHANTYLIVGDNSRFENFGKSRTGCFWIGEGDS